MKRLKAIPALILALLLIAGLLPALPAAAAGDIYVNGSNNVLSGGLGSAYAVGSGGTGFVTGNAYVMTADGITTIGGGSGSSTGSERPGRDETSPTPSHLTVTGSISLPYSKIRVGLYYYDGSSSIRNSTLESANLENEVGYGYLFGWYDSSRVFHQVGYTNETQITMAMDKNVTISSGAGLGCYHIMLPGTYYSFEEASAAAAQYGGFPAYYNGQYYALVGSFTSISEAQSAMSWYGVSGTVYTASQYCVTVCRTTDGTILFEFDCGRDQNLAVSPQSSSGKAVTWFKGYQYYGDFEYVRRSGEKLTVINIVNIEDYVKGVITYEMSADWPLEALKALSGTRFAVSPQEIAAGFAAARFPARLELLRQSPPVLLDGAHNPNGGRALCDAVKSLGLHDLTAVVGMLRDKDCLPVLQMMAPYCARMIVTTVPNPRSYPAEEFAGLARSVCPRVTVCPDCQEAARLALAEGGNGVLVFGSLYLASAVRPVMLAETEKNNAAPTV